MLFRKILYMAETARNQWLSAAKIEKLQFLKLQKIINHAYKNVIFYRNKLDSSGLKPQDIRTPADILKIPFTTKKEVLENFPKGLLARGYRLSDCHIESTSGSSGLKLKIAIDYRAKDFCDCIYGRALFAVGYKPWQPMAYFWPSTNHRREFHEYLGLMRKDWISSHIRPEEQLEILLKLKPRIIYGFPTIMMVLAKIIESDKAKYDAIKPELIISHAELLTTEARQRLERVFGCPVYNEYGATELGFRMAWECHKREGMHIDADSVLMEFIKNGRPAKPGETGEMIITGLVNHAMPLIRYQIGDIGIPTDRKCSCGRGLPLMEVIEGRKDDFMVLPSGKLISPRGVVPIVEKFKEILEFKIIQKDKARFLIELVFCEEPRPEILPVLKNDLLDFFNEYVDIAFEIQKEIKRSERGKLKAVVSEL